MTTAENKNKINLKSNNKEINYDFSVKSKNMLLREIDNLRKDYDKKSKLLSADILKYSAECFKKNEKINSTKIIELTELNNTNLSIVASDITELNNLVFETKKQISIQEKKTEAESKKQKEIADAEEVMKWIDSNKNVIAKLILNAKKSDTNFTNSKVLNALRNISTKTNKEE